MRVAGIPLGVLQKQQVGQVILNLPFTSNINDISSFNTPMSIAVGTADFSTGAMGLQNGARVRTGSNVNNPQPHLSLYNKLYEIEFDVKMQVASYPATIFGRTTQDSTNVGTINIDGVANTIIATDRNHTGIFPTYNLGFDSKAAFFNVKFRRTALASYELLINDVVVRTGSTGSGVMDDNTNNSLYHGFIFGSAATRPFFIKNFKVTTF